LEGELLFLNASRFVGGVWPNTAIPLWHPTQLSLPAASALSTHPNFDTMKTIKDEAAERRSQ
jgi:hypothetical protein